MEAQRGPRFARYRPDGWFRRRCDERDGRAGEIRTRGLLVPNQALYRAKLPPALTAGEIQTDNRSSAPAASNARTARARWLYWAFSSGAISPNVLPPSRTTHPHPYPTPPTPP